MNTSFVALLLGLALAGLAQAEEPACIGVKVAGAVAPAFDCLGKRMAAHTGGAPGNGRRAPDLEVSQRSTNALGLVNQSASSIRMGNQWGVGVKPQRPAP